MVFVETNFQAITSIPEEFQFCKEMVQQCLSLDPTCRPTWKVIIKKIISAQKYMRVHRFHPLHPDFSEADKFYDTFQPERALALYLELLNYDNSGWAEFRCAEIYKNRQNNNEGIKPRDESKASEFYKRAIEKFVKNIGNLDFRESYALGRMYYYGDGSVNSDKEEALEWLQKSAAKNFAPAQNDLGRMYEKGEGVPIDIGKAYELFRKSAEKNYAEAQFNLGWMYEFGDPFGDPLGIVKADAIQAVKWLTLAGDQGHLSALYNLAIMYEHGVGVGIDETKARELKNKISALGGNVWEEESEVDSEDVEGIIRKYVARRDADLEDMSSWEFIK